MEALYARCSCGYTGPYYDTAREIDTGTDSRENHVGRELCEHVANIEDGDGDIELVAHEAKMGFKVIETSLSGLGVSA